MQVTQVIHFNHWDTQQAVYCFRKGVMHLLVACEIFKDSLSYLKKKIHSAFQVWSASRDL